MLIVDDDDLVLSTTAMLVEALGYNATPSTTGEAAVEAVLGGLQPDLVILDLHMPGLGGTGTLHRLRALCPELPILIATGLADQKAHDLVQAHAGVNLLAKPFTIAALQGRLVESLGRPRMG